jgi:hypothetical protein
LDELDLGEILFFDPGICSGLNKPAESLDFEISRGLGFSIGIGEENPFGLVIGFCMLARR